MRNRNSQAASRLTITCIDRRGEFQAQFNPKEIAVDKTVPWQISTSATGDLPELQFTSAAPRAMSFELLFDTHEQNISVHTTYVAGLLSLATVMDAAGPQDKRRPPRVKVTWGAAMPAFEGVIESIGTKYTLFLPDGTPVRAICAVTIREAGRASFKKPSAQRRVLRNKSLST